MCSGSYEDYVPRTEPEPKHRKPMPPEQKRAEGAEAEQQKKCS
jgi:hypothetical protein